MRVVAVAGAKGGVGKTAAAVNLAILSARSGHRTLLWDLDPQGAATHCYRAQAKVKGGATRLLGGKRDLAAFIPVAAPNLFKWSAISLMSRMGLLACR